MCSFVRISGAPQKHMILARLSNISKNHYRKNHAVSGNPIKNSILFNTFWDALSPLSCKMLGKNQEMQPLSCKMLGKNRKVQPLQAKINVDVCSSFICFALFWLAWFLAWYPRTNIWYPGLAPPQIDHA